MIERHSPRQPQKPRLIELLVISASSCVLAACVVPVIFEIGFHLLFGWVSFLRRTLPNVTVDWPNAALAAALLAVFAFGVHRFGGWLRHELAGRRSPDERVGESVPVWRGRWTLTTVAGVVLLFVAGIAAVGVAHQVGWMMTSVQPVMSVNREAARRTQSKYNLRQIGLAFYAYHDDAGHLPPGMTLSNQLAPQHGWGTLLLPHVEEAALYEQVDLSRPWDDEVNREQSARVIPAYQNPGVYGPERNPDGYAVMHYAANSRLIYPGSRTRLRDIADGTSETILSGEVASNFQPWGSPYNWRDPAGGLNASASGFGGPWRGGETQMLFADGAVYMLNPEIDPDVLKALATPDDGESIPADSF